MEPMWDAFKRIIKPRGAIVLTASQPFTSALVMSNPAWFRYAWVWCKTMPTGYLNANNQPLKAHEDVMVFSPTRPPYFPQMVTGKPYNAKRGTSAQIYDDAGHDNNNTGFRYPTSVIFQPNPNRDNYHPTQKPVALFEYLIKTYTQPGELVFDPCVGSGTTAVAAHKTGRRYICGDFTREYVKIARQRVVDSDPYQPTKLNDSIEQLSLFGATNE